MCLLNLPHGLWQRRRIEPCTGHAIEHGRITGAVHVEQFGPIDDTSIVGNPEEVPLGLFDGVCGRHSVVLADPFARDGHHALHALQQTGGIGNDPFGEHGLVEQQLGKGLHFVRIWRFGPPRKTGS